MAKFERRFGLSEEMRVLDVGGTPTNWRYVSRQPWLVLLNIQPPHAGPAAEGPVQTLAELQ